MTNEKSHRKSVRSNVWNVVFFAGLIFFVFSTDAKSWVLRQLVSVGLFNAKIEKNAEAKSPTTGAHSFSFSDAGGAVRSTADLKGKVVFINFWATWCPPCRAEMPSLNALYNEFKGDERFVFLFISEDDDLSKAQRYLEENGFTVPLVTRAGNLPAELYSGTLPTTVVLDKEGSVVFKHEGVAGYNTSRFKQQLRDLL
jgi:thiol-disulfide isomerase/thioredoxin